MILTSFVLAFPSIDPVIFSVGPLAVRWYGLAYVAGILLGRQWLKNLCAKPPFLGHINEHHVDQFLSWAIISIVVGGRLGYILFYTPDIIWHDPLRIFQTWVGGMSFHGGLLGLILAIWRYTKKTHLPMILFWDLLVCATPIGLFFGRIANFINAELYGRVTYLPWGVVFPDAGPLPRHPSQLYEAFLEGCVLFILCNLLIKRPYFKTQEGRLSGVFLISYGLFRIGVECVREPDSHLGYFLSLLTWGQILSFPMIVGGIYLLLMKKQPT